APTPTRTPGLSQTATQTATPSPTSANLDFPSDESTPDASGSPAPATGSAGKLRFIVRAGRPTLSNGSRTQIIYACVFDTLPTMMKRSAPPTTTVTPTVDPALDRRAVVARDIQIKIDVPSAARISRGWSGPSQAEIYGRTARFYAPVLRDSETLAYAVQIEAGAATSLAWEVYVRDRRGPAVDVSAEVASGCDLAGLSLSPAGSSKSHQNPTPHSTADILVEISAVRFEDRETRAAADPKQHSLNYAGDSTQLVILIAAGVLSLISLTLAIALYRRQHSEPAEERPSVLGSRR
ncbi:MAG: hypothetical protein RMN25_11520, partial [Anaerolineae bacterium]|nr:hypothetical protein [Thermoflexales bacterium]MDW8408398.1 hypothetical protein [Anaerolineae bacterium]